tara:strand:+ start:29437 stop:29799 length:363 start_codon:yes stop_codon:yes gene_type:complete
MLDRTSSSPDRKARPWWIKESHSSGLNLALLGVTKSGKLSLWKKFKIVTSINQTFNQLQAMRSWKTSLGGILTALGVTLTQIEGPEWLSASGAVLVAVGGLLAGIFARDNDKTSSDVGAE